MLTKPSLILTYHCSDARNGYLSRLFWYACNGSSSTQLPQHERSYGAGRLFFALHRQHCYQQRVPVSASACRVMSCETLLLIEYSAMVSVPFHQILRSTCPVVAILIYRWVYGRTYSTATYLTMLPLILGCAIATAGDYQATAAGFFMTLLGVILASVKTVATNRIMTGPLSLSALEVSIYQQDLS